MSIARGHGLMAAIAPPTTTCEVRTLVARGTSGRPSVHHLPRTPLIAAVRPPSDLVCIPRSIRSGNFDQRLYAVHHRLRSRCFRVDPVKVTSAVHGHQANRVPCLLSLSHVLLE